MFAIELDKEYYAFNTGELYQLRRLIGNNTFSINNELLDLYDIEVTDGCVEVTFVNKCPVLVDAKEYMNKVNQSRFSMDWDLLSVFPLINEDYMMLEELSNYQNNEEKQKKALINKEIEKARSDLKVLKLKS